MNHRKLGRTGLDVSEIGVGGWQLAGPLLLDGKTDGHPDLGKGYVIDLIRRCGEMGINFIDTAEQYGAGEGERRVGEAVAGQRDRWIIGTQFGAQVGEVDLAGPNGIPSGKRCNDASAQRLPISLEGSLRRLQTDYIDVYLYHTSPSPSEAEGVARFLESAKAKGQVRAVGISTNQLPMCEFLLSLNCLDVVQFAQNLLDPRDELRAFLEVHNIGGVVRGAFAGGKLSGKYFHAPPELRQDDIRSNWSKPESLAEEFSRLSVFEEMVTPQRSMPQLALRYLLDFSTTHTIILGAKSEAEYFDAVKAAELPALSLDELQRIGELRQGLK